MSLKSKNVLFCGEITETSGSIIKVLLNENVKCLVIGNTIEDSIDQLGLADERVSHYAADLTKIEDLESR